ncbi:calcium-dependent protein kinase 12-like, partial [Gigantopelta aegis]|uniref:calcium-dependent protein kinase 12-like n=1 Tax=Gigantopelta aegis TaxID=1735272 RepID=UPI001B88AB75
FAAGAKMMGLEPGVEWSFDDFSKVHKESLQKPEYMAVMRELFNATFIMLDKDRKGFVTPNDWEQAFKVFRFNDPSEAKTAFDTLDLDKDGQIGYQEFMDCSLEFFCSEDNKHGSLGMLGPLPS